MNREGIIGYDIYIFRLLTHPLTALSKGLCHISLSLLCLVYMGLLHDDVILLQLPESFRLLFSCEN